MSGLKEVVTALKGFTSSSDGAKQQSSGNKEPPPSPSKGGKCSKRKHNDSDDDGDEISKGALKSLATQLGYSRDDVKRALTVDEAVKAFQDDITATKLRAVLSARKLPNKGGHKAKVRSAFEYESS